MHSKPLSPRLKPCPYCGHDPQHDAISVKYVNPACAFAGHEVHPGGWNHRAFAEDWALVCPAPPSWHVEESCQTALLDEPVYISADWADGEASIKITLPDLTEAEFTRLFMQDPCIERWL